MKENATGTSQQTLPREADVKVVTLELAYGRDWTWFADLRIVALAPHLDPTGRERALLELTVQLEQDAKGRRARLRRGAAAQRGL